MSSVYVYELYHSGSTTELIKELHSSLLCPEIVADIIRISIESKYWDVIAHINDFDLDYFELNDCNFDNYSLVDLKNFRSLTSMNPPEHLFNKLFIEQREDEEDLINFFGENCLTNFYDYLLETTDHHHEITKDLINSHKFPLSLISLERYCELVYYTFPEDDFFMNLALESYGNLFYNHFLDFLIKNQSCKHDLYEFLINKQAVNTVKPNFKEFEKYTNNLDFLNLLKTL